MRAYILGIAFIGAVTMGACAGTPHPEGKPIAARTYEHLEPLTLNAAQVDIQQLYDANADPQDVALQLVQPAHTALIDFAQNRFQAGGGIDTLRMVIEDAKVTKRIIQPENTALRWTGLANEEEYSFNVVIGLYRIAPGAYSGPGATISMKRAITIPESTSLAEREKDLSDFVQKMVADFDMRAQDILINTMKF